jgi:hypothetical protein
MCQTLERILIQIGSKMESQIRININTLCRSTKLHFNRNQTRGKYGIGKGNTFDV